MTSKNLFFKLMREDFRQRLWVPLLAFVVFLFALPVAGALLVSNGENFSDLSRVLVKYVSGESLSIFGMVTVVGALICGFSGFGYLHSKKKVDFYHSLPVRRETLFGAVFCNGLLFFAVPYLANLLLYFAFTAGHCRNFGDMAASARICFLFHFCYYVVVYAASALAVMLTGNGLVSGLAFGVFCLYVPAVQGLTAALRDVFYDTYYQGGLSILWDLSPIGSYFSAIGKAEVYIENGDEIVKSGGIAGKAMGSIAAMSGWALAAGIVLAGLCAVLYRLRPSEAAHKAIAFPKIKPVLYVLLAVPIGLLGGLLFYSVTDSHRLVWWIFGIVCFLLLAHAVLQALMEMEFKAIFKGAAKLGAVSALAAAISALFIFDLGGYDTYFPKESQFASAAVTFSNLDGNVYGYDGQFSYYDSSLYAEEHMELTDYKAVEALCRKAIAYTEEEPGLAEEELDGGNLFYTRMYVKYRLKNGGEKYRTYMLGTDSLAEIDSVFSSPEYKEGIYPVYLDGENAYTDVYFNNGLEMVGLELGHTDYLRLYRTFCEEYKTLTLEDFRERPFGQLTFNLEVNRGDCMQYYIMPAMEETIGLLSAAGAESFVQAMEKEDAVVTVDSSPMYYEILDAREKLYYGGGEAGDPVYPEKAQVTPDTESEAVPSVEGEAREPETAGSGRYFEQREPYPVVCYTGKLAVQALEASRPGELIRDFSLLYSNDESYLSCSVVFGTDEYGNAASWDFDFPDGDIPNFIQEDIGYQEMLEERNRLWGELQRKGEE